MGNRFIGERNDTTSPGSGSYEFGGAENEVFIATSRAMRIVGVLTGVFGAMFIIGALMGKHVELPQLLQIGEGVVMALVGGWLSHAASSLRNVADTVGQDIPNLMEAMRRLRSVYTLQAVMMVIGVLLGLATVGLAIKH